MVMAVTGGMMIFFITVHLLGNASVYAGPDGINAYAAKLHGLGPFVWLFRLFMLTMLLLHVFYGIQLTLENSGARPQRYKVKKELQSTLASRNMIWTGLLLGAFVLYHLLHFTFTVTNSEIAASRNLDPAGRPDVFMMVVLGFRSIAVSLVYVGAMVALGLHLLHGIQSLFQTLGLNSEGVFPVIVKAGTIAAVLFFLGYVSMPLSVLAGLLGP